MGDNYGGTTGEWSIIGGMGKLSMARGTIKYTVVQINNVENYKKLDFYGTYIPPVVSSQWYILFPFSSNVNKHISAVIFLFGKPVR
jgi:hypothetical protein